MVSAGTDRLDPGSRCDHDVFAPYVWMMDEVSLVVHLHA